MAYKQRTSVAAATQSALTDDPDFLRFVVERVIQEVLDAEMTSHPHDERIGAAQRRAQAAHAGRGNIAESGRLRAIGDGLVRGAIGGVGQWAALSRHQRPI